jgi:hypothetical protein
LCESCRKGIPPASEKVTLTDGIVDRGDTRDVTKTTTERVKTLADLVRVCEIDLEVWEIVEWHANKWEMGFKNAYQKADTLPLFQVKARLKKRGGVVLTMETLRKELLADISAASVPRKPFPTVEGEWLYEFAPVDLHMGKLTWAEETVTNYDMKIATEMFNASVEFLLDRAMKLTSGRIDRILCVFGNDVSHVDTKRGDTTAGTVMDVDSRYVRIYRRICAIHRAAIDRLREVAPVDVKIVSGNHDELTSFHLGEILSAIYEKDERVTIDNSPRQRKYYEYGVNLFGFAHGDSERVNELPLVMAREMPDAWARCNSREWHIGHKHISEKNNWHSQDLFSDKGVRVRRLTSMSAHDAWHTKHAYMDRRACEGFVFHKTAGFTDHLSFNIDHFTGRKLTV